MNPYRIRTTHHVVHLRPSRLTVATLLFVCLAGFVPQVAAQERKLEHPVKPGRADTTAVEADSVVFRFSLPPNPGTIITGTDTALVLSRDGMRWRDPSTLTRVVGSLPGVILLDQVQIGQYTSPTIDGIDWRSIGVFSNGRTLADPASGVYNLELMTEENLERLEVVTGPRAFLYGLNSTGGAINLVTRNYNSNRPFTRLFYSESSYGYAQTDGSFAQNVSRHANITAGFHFQGTDGRYTNEADQSWQVRGKIRYAVTPTISVLLSDYYTSTNTDLNGGVDRSQFSFATLDNAAVVANSDSYEKITRHDVDLTTIGTLFPDSTAVTTLSAYYSGDLREYRDEENRQNSNGLFVQQDQRSSWAGIQFMQSLSTPLGSFEACAMTERRQVEGSPTIGRRSTVLSAAWLKDEFTLADNITLAGYGRVQRILGSTRVGIGADARAEILPSMAVFGGLSSSSRVPNFTELYWMDSTARGDAGLSDERHMVAEAGFEWRKDQENFISVTVSHRSISHPILVTPVDTPFIFPRLRFTQGDHVNLTDVALGFSWRVWRLLVEGNGIVFVSRNGGTAADDLPRLRISGGAYFRDELFRGHLDLKTGFRGWFRTGYQGSLFNPQVLAFVPNTGLPLGRAASVDFVLLAHLGDAQIHFIWENLPGIAYFASPGYPGLDRVLRFGISWDFWN